MNELIYSFRENNVRVIMEGDTPWFVAKDVCEVLEISHHRDALSRLEEDERGSVVVDTLGGKQNLSAVNEYGIYSLIFNSRKPQAKEFKRWVTHEVIPSIRKNGLYATAETAENILNDPSFLIKALQTLEEERKARKQAEKVIEQQKPKVLFAESVEGSKDSILIGQLAKIITQNGYEIGQNRLFKWLRDNNYLYTKGSNLNEPMQRYVEQGLFEVKVSTLNFGDGSVKTNRTTKVTGKGQSYFVNKFLGAIK